MQTTAPIRHPDTIALINPTTTGRLMFVHAIQTRPTQVELFVMLFNAPRPAEHDGVAIDSAA